VKIRGFRIEPGEIEHRLRQHPAVKDAVVVVRSDPSGDRKLVAYVIAAPGAPPDGAQVRAFVAQGLPDYLVPNAIGFVAAFPATANGKLDRDALPWPLPAPHAAADAGAALDAAPGSARLAEEIAALFAGLLGVPRFDPSHDMWNQGATSFTVVQVSNALQARYGRRIPISAVVADPTAAGIARWLAAEIAAAPAPAAAPPPEAAPAPVDYFSADDRRRFKDGQWSVRPGAPGERVVALPPPRIATEHYRWRSSRRDLAPGPVSYDAFCQLLALLAQARVDGRARRMYPSAGDTYAVQVYVHVREGGVERLAPGIYYYQPLDHALRHVRARPALDASVHAVANRPLFDAAAFELYLIGQTHGIEPIYREHAERYLGLEAGHISQLLMMGQAACGLGLCPIGDLAFGRVRDALGLDDGHRFLLSMVGGRAAWPAATIGAAPVFAEHAPGEVAITGMAGRYPGADDPDAR
jgi:SagB-type dehydrogenase family enzyme